MGVMALAWVGFALIQALVFFVWKAAYRVQKTSIVDIFWSLFVLAAALVYFFLSEVKTVLGLICLGLMFLWALRLSFHIYWRSREHGEDPRYRALRDKWGGEEKKKMLIFYFQQGTVAWVFSIPFLILFLNPNGKLDFWMIAGILLWCFAFVGETLSDYQLYQFKKNTDNRGKVCRTGFWNYSRHPNYFFEWLNWVAFSWIALPAENGWIALICPVLIYYFLNKVSGIPLAEKQALQSRSAEYAEYQSVTSAFFPWFPKKKDHFS
ncbi:MAG TPA: hypothetical protein DIS66_01305 [Candidatus Omnitrophica bacterium]|nr:hypothetical protein [Candidatus Omnitrophota bacterium]